MARFNSSWGSINTEILQGDIWRVVESQEQIATMSLVDNIEEQDVLEQLLDGCKPSQPEDTKGLDYLLSTPFRYPPLRWGSRFGTANERGIFYGSETFNTVLAEVAYYRFLFWQGMSKAPPNPLQTQHTAFQAAYKCSLAVDVTKPPFKKRRKDMISKNSYELTQQVGTYLRENNCDGIRFESARCPDKGFNLAITKPKALKKKLPQNKRRLFCMTSKETVSFKILNNRKDNEQTMFHFSKKEFLVGRVFPVVS